jgi:hypothetical protein
MYKWLFLGAIVLSIVAGSRLYLHRDALDTLFDSEQQLSREQPILLLEEMNTYRDSNAGYSISIPKDWYDSGSSPNFTKKYFFNENAASMFDGSDNLVMLSISNIDIDSKRIEDEFSLEGYKRVLSQHEGEVVSKNGRRTVKLSTTTVNGNTMFKYSDEPNGEFETEYAYAITYALTKGKTLYEISFGTKYKYLSDSNKALYDKIATSFTLAN